MLKVSKRIIFLFFLAASLVCKTSYALTTSLSCGDESIVVEWPDAEGWGIGYEQDVGDQAIIETVIKPETVENWTQIGTVLVSRTSDAPLLNLDWIVQKQVEDSRTKAKDVKFEMLWQGIKDGIDIRIFVIKAKDYQDGTSETQVQFLAKGKNGLYNVQRTKRAPDLDKATIDQWAEFLKTVKITQETRRTK